MSILGRRAVALWHKGAGKSSPADQLILQAIDRQAGLCVTYRNGKSVVRLGDGMTVRRFGNFNLPASIHARWLVPDPTAPALLPGSYAQRYLVAPEFRSVEEAR